MMPTILYIQGIFYDFKDDKIFMALIIINDITMDYHKNGDGFKRLRLKADMKNSYDGSILLGTL